MLTKTIQIYLILMGILASTLFISTSCLAVDTDAYQVNSQQNTYMLLDTSGSMQYGVYEHGVDYKDMFDKLRIDPEIVPPSITTTFNRDEIYLVKGDTRMVISNGIAITGDAGGVPMSYVDGIDWILSTITSTNTSLATGSIKEISSSTARLSIATDATVMFDAVELPYNLSIVEHKYQPLYDGSTIDSGFSGLLVAPGYAFSGLSEIGTGAGGHVAAPSGTEDVYFFVTGNWLNYQKVCALDYVVAHIKYALRPWQEKSVDLTQEWFADTSHHIDYPEGSSDYGKKIDESQKITIVGATSIKIHFAEFDVASDDEVNIYQQDGTLIATYNNSNFNSGDWSAIGQGDTITVNFKSGNNNFGKGYLIDKTEYTRTPGNYHIESRLDVATDAIYYVLDEFRDNINWGYAYFDNGDGAKFQTKLNPTQSDINRKSIQANIKNVTAYGGTPLGEALQDVFEVGYFNNTGLKSAGTKKSPCSKNYAVVLSDGFPSTDGDWNRINGVTFSDFDGDGYTSDPSQSTAPSPDYYDDVAHWMYTHSWIDKSEVTAPDDSYDNVITHHIAFGTPNALLEDAAGESGGIYLTAYNRSQLIHALYSVAQMIGESVSFTAPAVSVDAENKIQNGDELYMGLFVPMNSRYWAGNLKKFIFGDGSADRPNIWDIYDAGNHVATDSEGNYLNNTDGFWGGDNDANDDDNHVGADLQEDGVGEVLIDRVLESFAAGSAFHEREIRIVSDNHLNLVDFSGNVTNSDLGVGTDELRKKIINWTYGYTFDSYADGAPTGVREWVLGPIIHSRPVILDYYNTTDPTVVDHRYIAIGAGDGMLHIFDDDDGEELLAFVPDDALSQLKNFETLFHQPLVDGEITLVRQKMSDTTIGQPKYLIFSQRRGGDSVIALDVSNSNPKDWTLAWEFSDTEMKQSWSSVEIAKIKTSAPGVTPAVYTEVAIFTGGYDPGEDNFPEPFYDFNNNGTKESNEWSQSDDTQDVNKNNVYDTHNADGNDYGRALYVVELATGNLLYSMKHCPDDGTEVTTGTAQTSKKFKYCFPADPTVVTGYVDEQLSVLRAIYTIDIYGNLFRFDYSDSEWAMHHVFSTNPGSLSESGTMAGGIDNDEPWRKVFYAPSVSWGGSGNFFDTTNYRYNDVSFEGTRNIASLYFGTGDREHPTYNLAHDRIYAIYDDTSVKAEKISTSGSIPVTSAPYGENNLLNLTCDELGLNTQKAGATATAAAQYKWGLNAILTDDVVNQLVMPMELDSSGGLGENDAKGWYVILDQQGADDYCDHCSYKADIDNDSIGARDNHYGEKVFSRLTLYAGTLYFTSYQPSFDDPCAPEGNGLSYALNYLNASAALNLNQNNDIYVEGDPGEDPEPKTLQKDITDRYRKVSNIKALPSALSPVTRKGKTYIPGFGEIVDRDRPIYYWLKH